MVTIHTIRCMKPSWTRIAILHILYLEFCMICYQKSEITLILHCKIWLCFWSFFQLLLRSMHGKHNILYQTGYIHHTKPVLWWFIEFSKLAHFLAIIFKIIPLKEEANPRGVTSVVTYIHLLYRSDFWFTVVEVEHLCRLISLISYNFWDNKCPLT